LYPKARLHCPWLSEENPRVIPHVGHSTPKNFFDGHVGESQTVPFSMASGATTNEIPSIAESANTSMPQEKAF